MGRKGRATHKPVSILAFLPLPVEVHGFVCCLLSGGGVGAGGGAYYVEG